MEIASGLDMAIEEAQRRVAERGIENADLKDVILASQAWMVWKLGGLLVNRNTEPRHLRAVVAKTAAPALGGAGIAAIVLEIIRLVLTR